MKYVTKEEVRGGGDEMPTERFYRLPEAKKQVIRQAAIKEFARVPFDKAYINQIIQNADISRGRFYTYFEDKQDVVRYIFEDSASQVKECCEKKLAENNGDFFAMLEWLFEFTVKKLNESKEMVEVVKHVFSYQENTKAFGLELGCRPPMGEIKPDETPVQWFLERICREKFQDQSEQKVETVMQLGMVSLLLAIRTYYQNPDDLEMIRNRYLDSLDVLKYGVLKR